MFSVLISSIMSFLGGPIVSGLLKAYQAKLDAGNTQEKILSDLAARELAVQQREIEISGQLRIAEIGRWYEPDHIASYVLIIYFSKIVVWDSILGWGSTPALHGAASDWAGLIMMFLFGKRGIENVARILKR